LSETDAHVTDAKVVDQKRQTLKIVQKVLYKK
jgi:hypothetical protein